MISPLRPYQAALANKKLRVEWACPPHPRHADFIAEQVYTQVRQLQPRRPATSQDELLRFEAWSPGEGDAGTLVLRYVFDHDFASQYDRTETWQAVVRVDLKGVATVEGWRVPNA